MVAIVKQAQAARDGIAPITDDARPENSLIVRGIMRLRKPEDSGLGDTLERLIAKFGGNKFKQIAKRLGVNCGCEDRQKYLNERYPYTTE